MNRTTVGGTWLLASLCIGAGFFEPFVYVEGQASQPIAVTAAVEIPASETGREMFRDVEFANGFGMGGYAKVDMSPLKARPIPDDGKPKDWEFGEGAHRNFVDASGRQVAALYEHLLIANHAIEIDQPDCLKFVQYNNYGLAAGDADRNQRLVKRVESNRHGAIRLYYNTKNEIRNVATAYAPVFADDLWPHLLHWQHYGPPLKFNEPRKISLDLRDLIRKAISRFGDVQANLSRDPAAYTLRDFNVGFEGLGHWESEIVLSGLSLRGYPSAGGDAIKTDE